MHVKRWMLVVFIGIALVVAGIDLVFLLQLSRFGDRLNDPLLRSTSARVLVRGAWSSLTYQVVIGAPTAVLGLLLIVYGVRNTLASVANALTPADGRGDRRPDLAAAAAGAGLPDRRDRRRDRPLDDAARPEAVHQQHHGRRDGDGRRRQLGPACSASSKMLPPGDIRNCLVALADAEPLMQDCSSTASTRAARRCRGHSFGNLLIAAMLNITGDFEEAVRQTSRVLAIRGRVLPSTLRHVHLLAELEDGTVVSGETTISAGGQRVHRMLLSDPDAEPLDETLTALANGGRHHHRPGQRLHERHSELPGEGHGGGRRRQPARSKIYVCNVMTQRGETSGFSASDHVRAIDRTGRPPRLRLRAGQLPKNPRSRRPAALRRCRARLGAARRGPDPRARATGRSRQLHQPDPRRPPRPRTRWRARS